MKKAIKKFMAALLAVAMLCAMAVPAFAASANNNGSITVKKAVNDQTYNAYRIFDLESYTTGKDGNYSYTLSEKWEKAGFASSTAFTTYFELDGNYVKAKDNLSDSTAADFAKLALTFAKTNNVSADATAVAAGEEAHFTNLPTGYYLVDTTVGSLCMLDTTADDVEIDEKNEVPDIDKTITGGTTENTSDAKIGDVVDYKVVVHAKKGAANYVVTDTMTEGLTFNNDIKVTVGSNTLTNGTDYDVTATEHGYTLTFSQTYLDTLTANSTDITITYSATLNSKAAIKGEEGANKNTVKLTYGNNIDTTEKFTETSTYKFDLVKTDDAKKLLADAHFSLYESEVGGEAIKLVDLGNGVYRVADKNDTVTTTDIVTVDTGIITIKGLNKATYYLEETKAPQGFNKLDSRQKVDLTDGNKLANMTDATTYVDGGVNVVNKSGTVLPSTGGMGTTLFYVIGGGLMVAAVILLVTKKRMENK